MLSVPRSILYINNAVSQYRIDSNILVSICIEISILFDNTADRWVPRTGVEKHCCEIFLKRTLTEKPLRRSEMTEHLRRDDANPEPAYKTTQSCYKFDPQPYNRCCFDFMSLTNCMILLYISAIWTSTCQQSTTDKLQKLETLIFCKAALQRFILWKALYK